MRTLFYAIVGVGSGYMLGQFAPTGIAAIGEPFSPIRDQAATSYAVYGLIFGAVVGLILDAIYSKKKV